MTFKPTPTLLALSLIAMATTVLAETERQLGAHEHGAAQLTLAVENQTLVVSLDSPAYNLVGFEQSPVSDAQREQVESALATLARADAVLSLPETARCSLESQALDAEGWARNGGYETHHDDHEDEHHDGHAEQHHDDHGHEDEHHDDQDNDHDHADSAHSDVLVEWTYRCENLEVLRTVTVSAFEHFPNLTDLQVQYIGDDWQGAAQLTPANPRLNLN